MNRKKIILGLGIVTFIVGFGFISFVAWWLNLLAAQETVTWHATQRGVVATGAYTLVGLALVAIGMIITLLAKLKK